MFSPLPSQEMLNWGWGREANGDLIVPGERCNSPRGTVLRRKLCGGSVQVAFGLVLQFLSDPPLTAEGPGMNRGCLYLPRSVRGN